MSNATFHFHLTYILSDCNAFSRFKRLVPWDCNFPRLTQIVPFNWNLYVRFTQFDPRKRFRRRELQPLSTSFVNRWNELQSEGTSSLFKQSAGIAIREDELYKSRERITTPRKRAAQFVITIYFRFLFMKIPMSLRYFRILYWTHLVNTH